MTRWLAAALTGVLALGCNPKPKDDGAKQKQEAPAEEATETPAETPLASTEPPKRPPRPGKPEVSAPDDVAEPPKDAERSDTGLASKVLEPATGLDAPRAFDRVEVEFVIWTRDGEMLDRSMDGKATKVFVHQLMPGFSEVLEEMKVGEKRRAWLPKELGFANNPGAPQKDLTLDVKLVSVERVPEPPPVPADVAAPPADASKTDSGLATKVLEKGTGKDHPSEHDEVKVHYTGWSADGRMFDSSVVRGEPMKFGVSKVIAGWTEGVQLMVVGEQRRLWIPENLAYQGRPGAPSGMLVFDVELLEIVKAPEPPKTPDDVAAPPKNAKKTDSGLSSVVLKKGTGKKHPTETSNVEVHYSGWTTDGKMFDSSVTRGKAITFRLNQVIPGWTEGVQLMVEGEKRRLWIPEELAYKGRPGAPAGMLVFDVELIKILE